MGLVKKYMDICEDLSDQLDELRKDYAKLKVENELLRGRLAHFEGLHEQGNVIITELQSQLEKTESN